MFTKLKTTTALLVVITALAGCAAQQKFGGMGMDSSMCRKMMEQGKCGCCQNMADMRTEGMVPGAGPMQCMRQDDKKIEAPVIKEETKSPDAEKHKAHHPGNAQ